ncbi:unnamed protein product [Didymodactylos carnosus]|uniref:Uncharacterized protein n=1 Tax=Didymodactylos carnosus TaxID=1234261 RepID=A0A814NKB5_9BILA|nr:unnamed protein product [Didymodactylos carnosus]CAF1093252.1 unnamed protein product [Didymodactylos carnosus]CAF3704541.1 unnamed protein product [Didymodactylos carnosus]CAF3858692.1 unnamed protein product [Didymodactylos carnosus]
MIMSRSVNILSNLVDEIYYRLTNTWQQTTKSLAVYNNENQIIGMSITSENDEQQLWKIKQLNDNNNFTLSTKLNKANQVLTLISEFPYKLKLAPLEEQSPYQQWIFVLTNYPHEQQSAYRIKSRYLETIDKQFHLDLLNDSTAENSYRVAMRQQRHYSGQYWKLTNR